MKKLLFIAILLAICYGIYAWLENQSGGAVTKTMQQAAGGQLVQGARAIESAREKVGQANVETVKAAVNRFKAEQGRLPSSLQEMVDKGYLDSVPGGLTYDSATGEVKAGG